MVVGRMVVWIWMVLRSRPFQSDTETRGLALACLVGPLFEVVCLSMFL